MPQLTGAKAKAVKEADTTNPMEAIPEGYYKMKLTKVESGKSKAGKPMWTWFFEVTGTKKKLREYTSLEDDALWKIATIFEAFGVPATTSTDTLLGKEVLAHIGVEIAEQGKMKGRKVNYIVGYPDQELEPEVFSASDVEAEAPKPAPKKAKAKKAADEEPDF